MWTVDRRGCHSNLRKYGDHFSTMFKTSGYILGVKYLFYNIKNVKSCIHVISKLNLDLYIPDHMLPQKDCFGDHLKLYLQHDETVHFDLAGLALVFDPRIRWDL